MSYSLKPWELTNYEKQGLRRIAAGEPVDYIAARLFETKLVKPRANPAVFNASLVAVEWCLTSAGRRMIKRMDKPAGTPGDQ